MTLKDWNNLSIWKRRSIVNVFFWNMSEEFKRDIAQEFHHNFNWPGEEGTNQEGRWYEIMLKNCKMDKNGRVKITIII